MRWFSVGDSHQIEYGELWRLPRTHLLWHTAKELRGTKMRVTFNLEVKVEIASFDKKRREVFIKLMSEAAKSLHAKTILLSDSVSPDMELIVSDGTGREEINLAGGK